jgi:sulfatase modifying factor 1
MFRTAWLCVALSVTLAAQQPARKALVIGNSAYKLHPPIATATSEAASMTSALERLKFAVASHTDLTIDALTRALRNFTASLAPGDIAFVYYSGYAIQYGTDNYLIPVDFPARRGDPDSQAYSVSVLEAAVRDKKATPRIIVLEACRENQSLLADFPEPGLSAPRADAPGTLVAHCAPAGRTVASSDFTSTLVKVLGNTGLTPYQVFQRVQAAIAATVGITPALTSTITVDMYLTGDPPKVLSTAQPSGPKAGEAKAHPTDRLDYVWIPPGKFQMGCVPADKECKPYESPRHEVTISKGFWMGKTEVDVVSYQSFVTASRMRMPKASRINPGWEKESHPMMEVTWDDAVKYCAWVGGRLPTEAEWEYAARAGLDGNLYPWGNDIDREMANFLGGKHGDRWDGTSPVRRFKPSAWNLHDMSGNVMEWTADWFAPDFYSKSAGATDPKGPDAGTDRVRRGGSWAANPDNLRLSRRWPAKPADGSNNTGFRCVIPEWPK